MTTKFITNAEVIVDALYHKTKPHAELTINDQQIKLSANHPISQQFKVFDKDTIQERLNGGSFFIHNEKLMDYRDRTYNGYIADENQIDKMMEVLGVNELSTRGRHHRGIMRTTQKDMLGKVWGSSDFNVPGMENGAGDMSSRLTFTWSPFNTYVDAEFDVIRMICENGAVGLTSLFNNRIPLINRWDEHLNIAYKQIQHKLSNYIRDRIGVMSKERASISNVMQVHQHATQRMSMESSSQNHHTVCYGIKSFTDVYQHLNGLIPVKVLSDRAACSHLASHITALDLYNMATELRTHTDGNDKSSGRALDMMVNKMLFDGDKVRPFMMGQYNAPKLASFSDANMAFFGKVA